MTTPAASQAYLRQPVSEADVERLFGLGASPGGVITGAHVAAAHLRADRRMLPYDLGVVRDLWCADETSYWRERATKVLLRDAGLPTGGESVVLTSTQYLEYLTVLFSDDPPTWLSVQKQMVLLQHWIYNLREEGGLSRHAGGAYKRWANVYQLHRESWANRRMFELIAKVARPGNDDDPASRIVDPAEVEARFPPALPLWESVHHYAHVHLGLVPSLSTAIANQVAGPPDHEDQFGLRAFIFGHVLTDGLPEPEQTLHPTYEKDPLLQPRLSRWLTETVHPDTGPLGPVTTADLIDLIHQMTGWTGGPVRYTPPAPTRGASITVAELRDFLIGASNALINEVNAPFADLLPGSDVTALEKDIEKGLLREHVEMEYTERILDDMATL